MSAAALGAPKAELHVHLEGTIEPELLFRLAARNGVEVPWADVEALRSSYRYDGLASFSQLYQTGLRVLRTERDFHELTAAYLVRAGEDHIVHAEVFVSPQAHMHRGVAMEAVLGGIHAAFAEAPDIGGGVIVGMQRHRDEADGVAMLREAVRHRDGIIGVGLGGLEVGNPPAKFARAFAEARANGWHTVAHAGEEGPASYVREAVEVLQVERIDHGVRAEEDPELMRVLADRQIPLTVCPLSNVMLRVFPDLAHHNLARLLRAGLCVTINSDDPPYFGGYLNDNLAQTSAALGLTEDEQFTLLANGFKAAFISPEQRASYLVALHQARGPAPARNAP